jgi:hypothetical protein
LCAAWSDVQLWVFKEFDDVVLAGDFNKLSGLLDIDAIELANDAQIVKVVQ